MTREEAIKILKTERYCQEDTPILKQVRKAYDMAIEALSEETSTLDTCPYYHHEPTGEPFCEMEDRRHGKWKDIDNYHRTAICSHCRKVTMFEKWGERTKPYDYCPNCGAKMDGGGDAE